MGFRKSRLLLVLVVVITTLGFGATTATAQTVDNVDVTLSDESGDGLDDSITIDVSVTEDNGATAVEFGAPFSLNLSETDQSQAAVVSVNDDQPNENVTFGSLGNSGTYTVIGGLSGQSAGDTGTVNAWVGDRQRSDADDTDEVNFVVDSASTPTGPISIRK